MGLINLRTNLKDLKFGNDEPGGGSSRQPFVQTRIPATDEPLQTGIANAGPILTGLGAGAAIGAIGGAAAGVAGGALAGAVVGLGVGLAYSNISGDPLRLPSAGTGGPDFLVRGGTLLPGILVNDAIRLTKFFTSTEGLLFTVKQNLLSRVSVRTQASSGILNDGVYTPISTLIQSVGNAFGLHVNKQGLNPFETRTYFDAIKNQNEENGSKDNRLSNLYDNITVNNTTAGNFGFVRGTTINDGNNILSYQGGPGSTLGIGKTNIRYATNNFGAPLKVRETKTNSTLDYKMLDGISNETHVQNSSFNGTKVVDFRKELKQNLNKTIFSDSPEYSGPNAKNIELRVNLGDPGNQFGKNLSSYTNGYSGDINQSFGAASPNSYDKINTLPIYNSTSTNTPILYNDLVKFRIGVINNDSPQQKTYIHFRAFLDQISDSYNSNWDPTKYIGRGENFYTYSGFDRKVSLSWTVAAQSKIELMPMYRKLNYLASVCSPDYSSFGYMRGNIVTLTIGGYFYEQPGIITSLNYEMNDGDSSWEIGIDDKGESDSSVKELPHLIKVTGFNFIPIHTFVPRKQQNIFSNQSGFIQQYGKEKYIALSAGDQDNYANLALNDPTSPIQDSILANFTTPLGDFNPNIFPQ